MGATEDDSSVGNIPHGPLLAFDGIIALGSQAQLEWADACCIDAGEILVIHQVLLAHGPMRTPDLMRVVGMSTVCLRAHLSYLARRPDPLVKRVRPGIW